MIIPIDENFRISSDQYQWIIQERKVAETGKNAGKERWVNVSYWGTVQGAVKGLSELMIRLHDSESLTDALEYIEKLSTKLTQALTPIIDVDLKGVKK